MTLKNSSQTGKTATGKNSKGSVSVEVVENRLRLRFRVNGKQRSFALGLHDSLENRKVAENKARQIELDIISDNFDETLAKYNPKQQKSGKLASEITISQLFQEFIEYKVPDVYKRTLEKYTATLNYLNDFQYSDGLFQKCLGDRVARHLSDYYAQQFADWLKEHNSERVLKERLGLLSACWEWAIKKQVVDYNPWQSLQKRVKVPPKQQPRPFTREEIRAIVNEFKQDSHYRHYYPYVICLFSTGLRTGECIGLTWGNFSNDFSYVWVGQSVSKGVRKTTKTNKGRSVPVTTELKEILQLIKPKDAKPEDPVFITRQGNLIDEHNFARRAWATLLKRLNIPYRRPYNCRHSFISHCIEEGNAPTTIAKVTGHDVRTLLDNYAGAVKEINIPKLF